VASGKTNDRNSKTPITWHHSQIAGEHAQGKGLNLGHRFLSVLAIDKGSREW